jgi:hypothetical protein
MLTSNKKQMGILLGACNQGLCSFHSLSEGVVALLIMLTQEHDLKGK